MNEQMIRWDDLQIVLAIAESGSLSGAGRQLGLSHATVFRRLNDMEERLGVSLFLRTARGYTPTPAGEDVASTARRVQAEVLGTERRIAGRDMKLSGTLRITTTDTLFYGLLSPLFADFRERHPDIQLEVQRPPLLLFTRLFGFNLCNQNPIEALGILPALRSRQGRSARSAFTRDG